MKPMTPTDARAQLIDQHDTLRLIMDTCDDLANELDAGRIEPETLTREIARLRLAFDAHNKFEEQILRPVLMAHDAFGAVRIDRMIDDHVQEHAAMRARLGAPATEGLRDIIETLRAHLEAEERYLLTSKALLDGTVSVESSG